MAERIKGLTIKLGADASELIKAVTQVNSQLRSTQTNLRDINKALKLDPGSINLLKDKQVELTNAIDQTKEKIAAEEKALRELENAGADRTSKEFQDLKTQIDIDNAALKDLEKQMRSFGSVSSQHLKAVGTKMQEIGGKISDVGAGMTTKVTAPIAAGFGIAVKAAADFEQQMSKVQAISGAGADDMAKLEEKARAMGETTKFSAVQAGEGLEFMSMAGWKTEQMLEGLDGIMYLAAASGEELGTTSDIVTDALTAFGMKAEESSRFADILAAASSNANTNVSMMGESFKYAAAPAGALGYTAEDVAIALGLMANSGIKADMAGTSLRNMFTRMAKPTKESAMAIERLGIELYDGEGQMFTFREVMDQLRKGFAEINMPLEEYDKQLEQLDQDLADGTLTQSKYDKALEELNLQAFGAEGAEKARAAAMLGGARAMSGLLAIANASEEDYQKLTAAVDGSSDAFAKLADGSIVPLNEALASGQEIIEQYDGAAQAMAATMGDNLNGDIVKLQSAASELAISIGQLLIPLAKDIVDKIQQVVDYLNSLDEDTKKTITTILGVVAAVGPILLIIGKLITGIGSVISAVGTIQGALAALAPIITGIGTAIGAAIPAIISVAAPILGVVAAIAAVTAAIVLCVKHWDQIKEVAKNVADEISEKWNEFKEWFSKLWEDIMTKAYNAAHGIKEKVSQAFKALVNNAILIFSNLKSSITTTFSNILSGVTSKVSNIASAIQNGFKGAISFITSLPSKALSWGSDIIDGIVSGIKNAISKIGDVMQDVADTIASFIHFSEPDVGPLANFHTFMPDMMSQLAKGIENGIPRIEDAMDQMTRSMVPQLQGAGSTTNNNNNQVSINVYGAQGQNVSELADLIQQRIIDNTVRQGVIFS